MNITLSDGKRLIKIARETIEAHLSGKSYDVGKIPQKFNEKCGVFVTLQSYPSHELRGCIGYPEPMSPLINALQDSATNAATRDPRFSPVTLEELNDITIEVTVLTPPKLINAKSPKEYPNKIKIGEDGLIVEHGLNKGLLLPQVPLEWDWSVEEFLSHTCTKAGLPQDYWLLKETKIYKFTGRIFSEIKPSGEVVESKPT